ncbi:MAG: GNAT family N-acetyltransferase [Archaeoglobaceae archaeon]
MLQFSFKHFTPRDKARVWQFLESLSLETKKYLSLAGTDTRTLYSSFKDGWEHSFPILLCIEKRVIGMGKLILFDDYSYIGCLVVSDEYQHKGYGSRIVKYLCALSLLNNRTRVLTEVMRENTKALNFFKRLGFRVIKENLWTYTLEKRL